MAVVKAQASISLAEVDDGKPGTAGSKDVPMTYIQTAQPTGTIVKNSIWWVGTTLKNVSAVKVWDGTAWVADSIAQSVLNIAELNSVTLNSAIINSPKISVPVDYIDRGGIHFTGTMTITDGLVDYEYKYNDGAWTGQTRISAAGFEQIMEGDSGITSMGRLALGTLSLSDSASNGSLSASQLAAMNLSGQLLWSGVASMNGDQTETLSTPVSKTGHGIVLVWSNFASQKAGNSRWNFEYIPKDWVAAHSGNGITYRIGAPSASTTVVTANEATKYVYITDTTIKGYTGNQYGGSTGYVLREVRAW